MKIGKKTHKVLVREVQREVISRKPIHIDFLEVAMDVTISAEYKVLQEVMSKYHGILEELNGFLEELCHPFSVL